MLSAFNLCKQIGTRSGPTKCQAWSWYNLFDSYMVFLKQFFEKSWFWKKNSRQQKSMKNFPWGQRVKSRQFQDINPLKHKEKKCIWKITSAEVVCCKQLPNITNLSIKANRVDPDQTAPITAVWSGSTLFVIEASKTFQQTRKQTTYGEG